METSNNYSLEQGFATTTLNDVVIQACLMERKECENLERRHKMVTEGKNLYKKEIDPYDCGENDGICGEINRAAFDKYGEKKCMEFFFKQIKKMGIRV